ncbi:helix-turn-helix domain-containing protein [Streptomyces sp. NPDC003015]
MLELREIKYLLALSEQLHFGRTARELYMSQSRVSQLASLGSKLIDRLRPLYEQMTDA